MYSAHSGSAKREDVGLAAVAGRRLVLRGEVARFGRRRRDGMRTMLLVYVTDEQGNWLREHQWVNYERAFRLAGVGAGDVIEFEARVEEYARGHLRGHEYEPVGVGYRVRDVSGVRRLWP